MNWRRILFTGILAAALIGTGLPFAATAWAGDHHDRAHWWREHERAEQDHARWWHEHHESDHDGHLHGDNTRDCGAIRERIRYDGQQAHQIIPGQHAKARQWYEDDIRNAENDLRTCRR